MYPSDGERRRSDVRSSGSLPSDGALLFVRYAFAPNELGYCGPADSRALFEYGSTGVVDRGLVDLAQGFLGAWPYLELIAAATGIGAPLDRRVVEAYWVGNTLLDCVDLSLFGNSLRDRFGKRAGQWWSALEEHIPAGAVPHHSFHVFGVYPWVGLLGSDRGETPLHVLDRCRIRWGRVVGVEGDRVVVRSRPLTWDGTSIGLGEERMETATRAVAGSTFVPNLEPGQWVSLHWHWVCDRLSERQLRALRTYTKRQFEITNRRVSRSGPAMALG